MRLNLPPLAHLASPCSRGSELSAVNPAAQDQACDRVHRLGQTVPVNIFLMAAADTIDERIFELQDRKRALAKGAFGGIRTAEQIRQMRLDDLRLLMGSNPA